METGENCTESGFKQPAAIHVQRFFAGPEENKYGESNRDLNPAIKVYYSTCWNHDDVSPAFSMYSVPIIRKKWKGYISVKDIELDRKYDGDKGH